MYFTFIQGILCKVYRGTVKSCLTCFVKISDRKKLTFDASLRLTRTEECGFLLTDIQYFIKWHDAAWYDMIKCPFVHLGLYVDVEIHI